MKGGFLTLLRNMSQAKLLNYGKLMRKVAAMVSAMVSAMTQETLLNSVKLLRKVSATVSATVSLHTLIKKYVENIP